MCLAFRSLERASRCYGGYFARIAWRNVAVYAICPCDMH
jgi:hypothetical protein